jgi:NAD-dependent deacetylase
MAVNEADLRRAAECLRAAPRVVVFTGAGVSAESGVATFRDEGGFWQQYPPEQFATWQGLLRTAALDPARLADFLLAVLEPIANARPNPAHAAIAELEKHVLTTVTTQNVDALHQEAGSVRVREIHGSFFEVVNGEGKLLNRLTRDDLRGVVDKLRGVRQGWVKLPALAAAVSPLLGLSPGGVRRPRLVLFGDQLAEPAWTWSQNDLNGCKVMLVVGTSGLVLPAAMLPVQAKQAGATVIQVDPHDAGAGTLWLQGTAGEVLPALVREAFGAGA